MEEKQEPQEIKDHESDSDSEWYENMANQPFLEAEVVHLTEMMVEQETDNDSEEQYFDRLQKTNTEISEAIFKNENDYIWQGLLRQVHNAKLDAPIISSNSEGYFPQKKAKASSNTLHYQKALIEIPVIPNSNHNDTTLMLLQQWLFSHLPQSSNFFQLVNSFINQTNYWQINPPPGFQQSFYVDDIIHPSFIGSIRMNSKFNFIEVMIFQSLSLYHPDNRKLTTTLMNALIHHVFDKYYEFPLIKEGIESEFQRRQLPCSFRFAGLDADLYEEIFLKSISTEPNLQTLSTSSLLGKSQFNGFDFTFQEEWDESCHLYVFSALDSPSILELTENEKVDLNKSNLILDKIRESDASVVNGTWKYRSDYSIYMVQRMIKSGRCIGIRNIITDELVSWCLTYDNGALGMLYTKEEFRGQGLGKVVVKALIKCLFTEFQYSSAPFCFIEISNVSSMKLFQSLSFLKIKDVLWKGIESRRKN